MSTDSTDLDLPEYDEANRCPGCNMPGGAHCDPGCSSGCRECRKGGTDAPGYQPFDEESGRFGVLEVAPDPGIAVQEAAEEKLPLGFCSPCVSRVKGEFIAGEPEGEPVRAAVTLVTHQQEIRIRGQVPGTFQTVTVALAMPTCWECIVMVERPSNLLAG